MPPVLTRVPVTLSEPEYRAALRCGRLKQGSPISDVAEVLRGALAVALDACAKIPLEGDGPPDQVPIAESARPRQVPQ